MEERGLWSCSSEKSMPSNTLAQHVMFPQLMKLQGRQLSRLSELVQVGHTQTGLCRDTHRRDSVGTHTDGTLSGHIQTGLCPPWSAFLSWGHWLTMQPRLLLSLPICE